MARSRRAPKSAAYWPSVRLAGHEDAGDGLLVVVVGVEHVVGARLPGVEESAFLALEAQVGVPEHAGLHEGGLVLPARGVHPGAELLVEGPQHALLPGAAVVAVVVHARVGLVERVEADDAGELVLGEVPGEVAHGLLRGGQEGVLDADGARLGGQGAVAPEVTGGASDGLVLGDVLAPVEADAAGLLGVAARVDDPFRRAVAAVPAVLVEEVAGVQVLVEVGEDPDSGVEERLQLRGGALQIGGVHLAGPGLDTGPGEQETHRVGPGQVPHGGGGRPGIGGAGERKSAVLLQFGLAGHIEPAQHDLAAVTVGEPGALHGHLVRRPAVEPGRLGRGRRGARSPDRRQQQDGRPQQPGATRSGAADPYPSRLMSRHGPTVQKI